MEKWKDIKGYEGVYQVSDLGRVKSLRRSVHNSSNGGYFIDEKILKQSNGGNNYFVVGLSKNMKSKSFYVHRLVAETFLIKKENLVIDHLRIDMANTLKFGNGQWATKAMGNKSWLNTCI
jgi:hypothetical protein